MSESEVLDAIRLYVSRQNNGWNFVLGRDLMSKNEVLRKLNTDKSFRKFLVRIVIDQTIEILGGMPK